MRQQRESLPTSIRLTLIAGGVTCILGSLLLGFYLAHASASIEGRREVPAALSRSQGDHEAPPGVDANPSRWLPPGPVVGLMWATFGVGCLLALWGRKAGVESRVARISEKGPWPEV